MSHYCKNACGEQGLPGKLCTFMCIRCETQCDGTFIKSLKESIGRNQFSCKCKQVVKVENTNKRICI